MHNYVEKLQGGFNVIFEGIEDIGKIIAILTMHCANNLTEITKDAF